MRMIVAAVALALLLPGSAAAAQDKVKVCHRPPDNPLNYHTITISPKALADHLAHGDIVGECQFACEQLCDDGDKCTIHVGVWNSRAQRCDCSNAGPVNCDDGNACTTDSCDPATGCGNQALVGHSCDDGNVCTGGDQCNAEGQCVGIAFTGCCLRDSYCSRGNLCETVACDAATHACVTQTVECASPDLCTVGICNPATGGCAFVAKDCDDSDPATIDSCETSTGQCVHTPAPPLSLCAAGISAQVFSSSMHGCTGPVFFASRATLCAAGAHACTGDEWNQHRGAIAPSQSYWTGDNPLKFVGGTTGACVVSATAGTNLCDTAHGGASDGSMLVCPNAGPPTCQITGCGLDTTTQQFFGGCSVPTVGMANGTLCCVP